MTPGERSQPEIIDKSRSSRIARGSGRRSRDVRDLVARFDQMREMMASLGSGGMLSKVPGLGRLAGAGGGLDPGLLAGPDGARPGPGRRASERRRSHQKGKRKQARKARRKNRRR
jgi:signal recognition particle subunit SRP54